ncbi:protein ripply2 [Pseudochaenichthys georgianus]|uniref:protein ripply2 n=1 Tax=Pseudochaenichthys georgianus TaxID=52239 RepID=UPI00146BA8A8|nr:protein ripply2 [Pseudochaenichthys georgianus]
MEAINNNVGLPSVFSPGNNGTQQSGHMWRPWTAENNTTAHMAHSIQGEMSATQDPKASQVVHPVKLYWPKSRCFDYLYQDAEMLLRNYPVQATICLYADSSSDEDSDDDDDEEEEMEKELN